MLRHELWEDADGGGHTFCLAGPMGDGARALLGPRATLIWTVDAGSHFEAMTKYYERMKWGLYSTEFAADFEPYSDQWAEAQNTQASLEGTDDTTNGSPAS
jgi:hypothetical protein